MRTFFKQLNLVAILIVAAVALFILGSLLPVDGNYAFRVVQSGSMEPAIKTGAVIATIPRDTYTVGDIVTFEGTAVNPMPTTHRIVGIAKSGEGALYATKGDANEEQDYRQVREGEILGKVFLNIPYAGYMANFFSTPNGKAVLATLAILILCGAFMPWKRLRRQDGLHHDAN